MKGINAHIGDTPASLEEFPVFQSSSRFELVRAIDEERFLRYVFGGLRRLVNRNREDADQVNPQS